MTINFPTDINISMERLNNCNIFNELTKILGGGKHIWFLINLRNEYIIGIMYPTSDIF